MTSFLVSRALHGMNAADLPRVAEALPISPEMVSRIARNAVYAEVFYEGKTFLRDNTTHLATACNPRYGVWNPHGRYETDRIRGILGVKPNIVGKLRLAVQPSSVDRFPGCQLGQELERLGDRYPWELPEERQLVDLASPAGQIVMTVVREHLAPQIQLAQRAQVKAAKTMIDFAQSILPADAV